MPPVSPRAVQVFSSFHLFGVNSVAVNTETMVLEKIESRDETHFLPRLVIGQDWSVFAGCVDEWSDMIGPLQHLSPAPCVITASVAGE